MTTTTLSVLLAVACMVPAQCAAASAAHACDISDPCGAEPAPLPRLYLPLVQHLRMSAEYTPAKPVTTPEPETGDHTKGAPHAD